MKPRVPRTDPFWLSSLLNDVTLRLCAVFTLVLALMPPDGLGVELCGCQRYTGAPCPGCGITRCGSNLLRGDLVRAAQYHPFGLLVVPAVVGLGVLGLLPRRWREAARGRLALGARKWRPLWPIALGGFVVYGVVRWVCVMAGLAAFPATWP